MAAEINRGGERRSGNDVSISATIEILVLECAGRGSGDGALDMEDKLQSVYDLDDKLKLIGHPKRRRRCSLPAHSKLATQREIIEVDHAVRL